MPTKQSTPGGGGRQRVDSFSYERTPPDRPWTGWLAGEPRWVKAHLTPNAPTKVCVDWTTDGKIRCARCGPKAVIEDVGYVPVYRESDGAPILVLVYDTSYDFLTKCKPLDYVRASREGAATERVTVQRCPHQKKYTTALKRRHVAVDISEQLVRLWNINEYTEWYSVQPGNKCVASGPPTKAALDAPTVAEIAGTVSLPIDATDTETLAAEFERRARINDAIEKGKAAQRAMSNGKHKPT